MASGYSVCLFYLLTFTFASSLLARTNIRAQRNHFSLAAQSPTNLWLFPCYTAFSTAGAVCVPTLSEKNLILMYETSCMKYIDCVPIYFIHVL